MKPIEFVCPLCKGELQPQPEAYFCPRDQRTYRVQLGIPDFRLFPDPYITIEDDYAKGQALARYYQESSFPQLMARYWEMTPGVPDNLVHGYIQNVLDRPARALKTWGTINALGGPIERGWLLEVGCGTAGFLAGVAPAFDQAVGVDLAFRWLVVARKRLQELGMENITLVCACAEHLPFPQDFFHLVAAEDVLDHTRDPQKFMQESARVLQRQNGLFYLSTPNRYSLGPDPHVRVWGVGFLPPRFRDRYVRWRSGASYGPIRPVSYGQLRRLLRRASLGPYRVILPEMGDLDQQGLSPWQRTQARLYESARRLPLLRQALPLMAPSFQVLSRRSLHQ
jgi:ubiquinone/menaquinone biosynthesis C-methylase UbiE/uncharacterized protein YbaR (Trm112 family)